MGFRFVPTSMTLNDLERRSLFCVFLSNSIDFQADYITVVELTNIRKILSPSSTLPSLLAKTITHPAAWSLCDIAAV